MWGRGCGSRRFSLRMGRMTKKTPDPLGIALGRELAAARVRRGWTQQQLADAAGMNQSTIRNYELGTHTPTVANLVWLARTLEASVGAMMDAALKATEQDTGE